MVSWDNFDEGVEWYTKHLGWQCLDKVVSAVGKKAFLKMPGAGVVTLKSFQADLEHFQRGSGQEGNVRLCFEMTNVEQVLAYFQEQGIKTGPIKTLPNGSRSFDFYGYEQARLTVFENPEAEDFADSRVNGFGPVNTLIGVTDIEKAAEWYKEHLGFLVVTVDAEQGYAHLQTEDAYFKNNLQQTLLDNIYLEKIEQTEYVEGDPSVRTYFDIRPEELEEAYQQLVNKGFKPSQIAGNHLDGWAGFHFFDPDGNRINVWSYQLM